MKSRSVPPVVLAILVFLTATQLIRASLPQGWSDADIGSPGLFGSAVQADGVWTLAGTGAEICSSDQLHFVWTRMSGDGSVSARLAQLQNSSVGQAGIMVRNETARGGSYVALLVTSTSGVTFQWRNTLGLSCSYQVGLGSRGLGPPMWLRIERAGSDFSGYWSTNGVDWLQAGSTQTLPINQNPLVGLAVSASDNSTLCVATFDNVDVPPPIFGVRRELWTGLNATAGDTLEALTNIALNPDWPTAPNSNYTMIFQDFETETGTGMEYYGQRLRAFMVAPLSGAYRFWIASGHISELFLSGDEAPEKARPIAWVNGSCNPREWTRETNQQSAPVVLEAGRRYYLEALAQHTTGTDNLAVRCQLPNGSFDEPLTALSPNRTLLIPFRDGSSPPGIYGEPTNMTVLDGLEASFGVLVTNQGPVTYQWLTNGAPVAAAAGNGPVYAIHGADPRVDNNQVFSCVVSNASGSITSSPALLTVVADATPPTALKATYVEPTRVRIVFSEEVDVASVTNVENYAFTNRLPVLGVALDADGLTATLTTGPMAEGSNYVVILNGIRDRATVPNLIAPNTALQFVASLYAPEAIGSPLSSGTVIGVPGGYDITGAGADIGSSSDQFQFAYVALSGDFDYRVRMGGLTQTDPFAKAGLVAREDLTPRARFAGVLVTPSLNGAFFEGRSSAGAKATVSGNVPVNFPESWLRLRRSGDLFTGYASFDGVAWQELGSITLPLTNSVFLGMAVSSHDSRTSAIAQFRDIGEVTNAATGALSLPVEPLGPSSRKTPLVISEIMWKPPARSDGKDLEFIELYNSNPWFQDISGYQIVGDSMSYTFPAGSVLGGGAFLVVAAEPNNITSVYGITNVVGPYTGTFKKSGTVRLLDEQSAVLLEVPYSDRFPWPTGASGTGHSLVLARPTYGEADPRAWATSDVVGGSPGAMDAFRPTPLRNVVINELLAHSEDVGAPQFIELYNTSAQAVEVSGCILTDDPQTNKFVLPAGSLLQPGGFLSFDQAQLGFGLDGAGGTVYLLSPDGAQVIDSVQFGAQADGASFGRFPDGANAFYSLSSRTAGAPNASQRIGDVVINELMYDPISGDDDDQYIELYNQGAQSLRLDNWQFSDGIAFSFAAGVSIAPGGYLVIARNPANLWSKYPNLNATNTVGPFKGTLAHGGERLALARPEPLRTAQGQKVTTNIIYVVEDEVTYGTGGRWGQWAHGGGSSLELLNPRANHRLAANWGDSDETHKSSWATIETTGALDNGQNYDSGFRYAQLGLLDVGECLVDNIEVRAGTSGQNLVINPDFESGIGNWYMQGCHSRSSLENEGSASAHSLHIRNSDRFWTGNNSCEMALTSNSLGQGQTATLRFKARWLRGCPEPLLRLNGNWLETTGRLPVPANLGTPGMRNSRYAADPGPAIFDVTHNPPLPASGQDVVVTARVDDPDGLGSLTLNYRIDPLTSYSSVPMRDDGTAGDALAGDGIYSAVIPGRGPRVIAAFYISATDSLDASSRFPALTDAEANAPAPECLVMFGDTGSGGSFGAYHLWVSRTNTTLWTSLSDLSNEAHDSTMVSGTRIIYNVHARYAGSPYHQTFNGPSGSPCHYKWIFPDDDRFLGATSFNKIHAPGNGAGDDASIQREQLANTFLRALGVPWLYRRYVAVFVNGVRRGTLLEDAQTPDGDVVDEHFPNDTHGWLYKMQPWFEFAPVPSGISMAFNNMSWCNLVPYLTTGGAKKVARYRYNFLVRRTPTSQSDFTNVFSLIDAAGSYGSPNYVARMENLADMENWMRVFAANHAAGNWDSFGAQNSQNLYGYLGTRGTKYSLLMFDFNIVFGNSGSWDPGQNLFSVNGQDRNTRNIYNEPEFRRMYWRALQELVNGPLDVTKSGPLIDTKYNTFAANGLNVQNPATIKSWLSSARSSIASQLASENATGFTVSRNVTVSGNVAYLTGSAPVSVKTVAVNGAEWPITWTSVTGFRVAVPLGPGVNPLSIVGMDIHGQQIDGASNYLTATFSGSLPSLAGQIVINEIMCRPTLPGAQYVELYNTSDSITFDLSGCQIPELACTFPGGSIIGPEGYLVITANRAAFAAAYGDATPPFAVFGGELSPDGGTLTLLKPGRTSAEDQVIAKVRYSSAPPWPEPAQAPGYSLQLIDPLQDNWRVGNWALGHTNGSGTSGPKWRHVVFTGTAPRPILLICMHGAPGDVYIDDLNLVAGGVAGAGPNLLDNGGFESALSGPWTVSSKMAGSTLDTKVKHSGNASLHLIATDYGDTIPDSIWENTAPITTNGTYTLSYWYLPGNSGSQLLVRISGSSPGDGTVYSLEDLQPTDSGAPAQATPGGPNSVSASLPPFPPLWLNELQPENITGITNRAGAHSPWLELYNPSGAAVSLDGLYLSVDYGNLTQWAFPPQSQINAGEFKVIFADGQTNLSTSGDLHTSFVLPQGSGSLALSRIYEPDGSAQALDFVDYTNIAPDHSYGAAPDGQSFDRRELARPTPGGTNNQVLPPSFVPYTQPGSVYTQGFNSLPNPGISSVNADNPVTLNGVVYSLANPVDFSAPASADAEGGLGISGLVGWHGAANKGEKFGAAAGDQTTGGQVSFGLPGNPNRALGLLATSSTGPTAFGVRFVNETAATLSYINLRFTGELWRQSDLSKTLHCSYWIDPDAAAAFPANYTAGLPALDVSFPTSPFAAGGAAVDGTLPGNQSRLGIADQPISNWPPGAALWLVWEMADASGKAQGLAIDDLSFSAWAEPGAANPQVSLQTSAGNLLLSWPGQVGESYQLEYKDDLSPGPWSALGPVLSGTGVPLTASSALTNSVQRFFRLRVLP